MEKTLVSVNVPNLITINLMAWIGFLIAVVIWQLIGKRFAPQTASTDGGY
jgi:hypothetical protein